MTSDETPQSGERKEQRPTARPLDAPTLFSALALLVSFAALFVSLYETSILDTQNRASVWPYLQLSSSYSEDGWGLKVTNRGVGPARVTEQKVRINGKTFDNPLALTRELAGGDPGFGYNVIYASNTRDDVLSPESTVRLYFLPWGDLTKPVIDKAANAKIEAEMCYCSIFDECWRVELNKPAKRDETCRKPVDR